jgi:hypothetical protein
MIGMGIAHEIMYLHCHKIIHRDLKSPNILLDDRLLPKIADFGLGRFVTELDQSQKMTGNIGTPIWMAPELLRAIEYGPPVDVYAYGIILYEMYTERVPFGGMDRMRISKIVCEDEGRPPFSVLHDENTPIGILIRECWAAEPKLRPTFEQIYARFASGAVSFPGSNPAGTKILTHEIEQEEGIMSTAVADLAQEINAILKLRAVRRPVQDIQDIMSECAAQGDFAGLNEILSAFVHKVDINAADSRGWPPIHLACRNGHIVIVQYILKIKRADKNVRDPDGNTPLMTAVKFGQQRIAALLLSSQGVDVNAQNKFGWTALHIAALLQDGWREAMVALLAAAEGLRTDLEDFAGKKPFADQPQLLGIFQAKQSEFAARRPSPSARQST